MILSPIAKDQMITRARNCPTYVINKSRQMVSSKLVPQHKQSEGKKHRANTNPKAQPSVRD